MLRACCRRRLRDWRSMQIESLTRIMTNIRRHGLGILVSLACLGVLYKMILVPLLPAQQVVWMGRLNLTLAILSSLSVFYLTWTAWIGKEVPGALLRARLFCLSVILVLSSYAIHWHLQYEFFRYIHLLPILSISLAAVVQASLWRQEEVHEVAVPDARGELHFNSSASARNSLVWIGPLVVVGVVILGMTLITNLRTVRFEDIYITFRYGWNLASGNGINWNVTDAIPAEGYTTFTYVILSALFFASRIDPLPGMQVVNLMALAVLLYLAWELSRHIFRNGPEEQRYNLQALLPVALLLWLPATPFHVATGMETMFYTATLAGISFGAICWLENPGQIRWLYFLGSIILLSGLTRPDGIAYGAIVLLTLAVLSQGALLRWRNLLALVVTAGIPGIIYFIWRLSYFKTLLPLSFYHKAFVGGLYGEATRNVLFTDFVGMLILPYLAFIVYRIFSRRLPPSAYILLIPCGLLTLYYSRVLAVAGLEYRFFYPYLFGFLIVGADEFASLLDLGSAQDQLLLRLATSVSGILILGYLCLGTSFFTTSNNLTAFMRGDTYHEAYDAYPQIGHALLNIDRSEPIGIGEVGKIGMLLRDYTVVDVVGLNDRYLALNPFSMEYLDQRGVNILFAFPYPRAPWGVYADVYYKLGQGFEQIEEKFSCVGHIGGLDVFIRTSPHRMLEKFLPLLKQSQHFREGVCESTTSQRWAPYTVNVSLKGWQVSDLKPLDEEGRRYAPTASYPILRSPVLNIPADRFYNVIVNAVLPKPADCRVFILYFSRTDAPEESPQRSMIVGYEPGPDPQAIVFNVRKHPEWKGTISQLRLDPLDPYCKANLDKIPTQIEIQNVILH